VYTLFLTLRYLRRHPIVYLCIIGVFLGTGVLTIVVAIFNGFGITMRERIRGIQGHLTVERISSDLYIVDYEPLVEEIRRLPHVLGAAPRIEYMAQRQTQIGVVPMRILGIDPKYERDTSDLERFFKQGGKEGFSFVPDEGKPPEGRAAVGGHQSPFIAGARFHLTAVRLGTVSPIFCTSEFHSVGRFRTGMMEHDDGLVMMPLEAAQGFLKLGPPDGPPCVNQIAVRIDDYEANVDRVRGAIGALLAAQGRNPRSYRAKPWEQTHEMLLKAVDVEKKIQIMLMFFIILISGFNIMAIYTLMARAKTHDIGVIKALGGSTGGVAAIFMMSGLLLGLIGSFLGSVVGMLLSTYANPVADFLAALTKDLSHWSVPKRWSAAVGFLLLGIGHILLRVLAFLKPRWAERAWHASLVVYSLLGIPLAVLLSIRLVQTLPAGPWTWSYAAVLGLMAAAYGWICVQAVRHAAKFGSLTEDQADLVRMPGSVTYWVSVVAAMLAALIFAGMNLSRVKPAWKMELFPKEVYYMDRIPTEIDYPLVAAGIVGATVVTLIFSIFPAVIAASQPVVEAIRHE
jgi:lipoprotein-releasing system permease protein